MRTVPCVSISTGCQSWIPIEGKICLPVFVGLVVAGEVIRRGSPALLRKGQLKILADAGRRRRYAVCYPNVFVSAVLEWMECEGQPINMGYDPNS